MRLSTRRLTAALAAAGLTTVLGTSSAHAGVGSTTILRSWATGVCVDSNYNGAAYAISCNGGVYQDWYIGTSHGAATVCGAYGCGPEVFLTDSLTGLRLTNTGGGNVSTTAPTSGYWSPQSWVMTGNDNVTQFQNEHTGQCLQTNGDGRLFTTGCGSNYQDWKQGF